MFFSLISITLLNVGLQKFMLNIDSQVGDFLTYIVFYFKGAALLQAI